MALLITLSGKAITIYAPCGIITEVLLTNPKPLHPRLYLFVRALGWLGFACHVVSLGMAALVNQLITAAIIMTATVLVANRVCCDDLTSDLRLKYRGSMRHWEMIRGLVLVFAWT
jgi:hypothetical protein